MTDAPERIWAVIGYAKGTDIRGEFASSVTSFWRDQKPVSYILATPEALAASPEVAALIAEARREGWNAAKEAAAKHVVELTHSIRLGCFLSADKETDLVLHPIGQCAAAIRALKETTP